MYDKAGSVLRLEMVINEPEGFKVRKQVLRHLIDTDLYVYSRGWKGETPRFYPLRAPDDPDVAAVAETVSRRTQALWRKKGIGASDDGEAENLLMRDTPWLAELYAHGVRGASPRGRTPGKLVALVPAPRFHLVKYFGILASAAIQRPPIVPPPASGMESCGHRDTSEKEKPHARNYSWSQLMARIFAVDVLKCPHCGGRMRILAAIEDPSVARTILDCLGLPSRPPPVAPARRNRHTELHEF